MVIIISAVFPPEPVVSAQISNDLANALSANHEVVVICPRSSRPAGTTYSMEDYEKRPFKRIILKSYVYPGSLFIGRMIESIGFGRASKKFIKENQETITVIYANTWPLFAQLSVARACRKYNIPLVLHVQDIYPETLTDKLGVSGIPIKKLLLPIDRHVLTQSKVIIAIGKKMADYLSSTRGIDNNKITVINNWQDETRFTELGPDSLHNRKFTFMYLGSLSPSANIENVIVAFGEVGLNDSKLVIAGNGNSKNSCIKAAKQYPDFDIEFIEAPSEKTPELLSMADILVLPLKKGAGRYSIPSKLAGYMLSAKPVLAYVDTDSDTADIVTSAGCGWVVTAGDETALVNKMKEVTALPGTVLSVLGASGRSYALQHLSKKVNLEKLVQTMDKAVN